MDKVLAQVEDRLKGQAAPSKPRELGPQNSPVSSTKARQTILKKIDKIVLPKVGPYARLPLSEVVKSLIEDCKKADPEGKGVTMLINSFLEDAPTITSPAATPRAVVPKPPIAVGDVNITIDSELSDLPLIYALDVIVKSADQRIKFIVEDYAIVFTAAQQTGPQLYTRTFKVDPSVFMQGLQSVIQRPSGVPGVAVTPGGQQVNQANTLQAFDQFLASITRVPKGDRSQSTKVNVTARFDPQSGVITATASQSDLDALGSAIDSVIKAATPAPPKPAQVMIEAKLAEISDSVARELGLLWFTANPAMAAVADPKQASTTITHPAPDTNRVVSVNAIANMSALLTDAQFGALLRTLERKDGVDVLSAPRVTTLSGRQAQVQVSEVQTVVVGKVDGSPLADGVELSADGKTLLRKLWTGPMLDVTPTAKADGSAVELQWRFTFTEFLGYDDPGPFVPSNAGSQGAKTGVPLPRSRQRMVQNSFVVPGGQTLMIGAGVVDAPSSAPGAKAKEKRHLLIFLTPVLVDEAGQPVKP